MQQERIAFVAPPKKPTRPYLGVMFEVTELGVVLIEVLEDGPMQQAEVKAGDVLLAIDDQAMTSHRDVLGFLDNKKPGDEVKVKLKRGDETIERTIKLGQR